MEADQCLTFGDFSLDLAREQLVGGGEVVALTPKAFAVLRRLVEDGGQLVSKEELLRAGWAKTHVSDGVLKVIILEIRRALGDDPAAPSFIETVPRRGYRFIAPRSRPAPLVAAPDPRTALVGRDAVLAQLDDRFTRARAGQRQLVFLSGEAGIGKTAVLDAFLARAASAPDVLVARGACLEHYGAAEAYLPVLEAFGRLLREPRAERVLRVLKTHAPTWLVQLPWRDEEGERAALPREVVGATKERMLREMAEALEALTATTPLLLVLEDLHWSDYSTLDLLGMQARRREAARLLVVGSYRSVDVIVQPHPLRPLIQELRVRRECEDIALPFLREPHVAAYLAQRFGGHAFPSALARAVHQRTDGNPLFMVRVVDELVALRVLEREDDRWRLRQPVAELVHAVPESLRALVDKQIDRLPPESQRVLEAASVLGNEFTVGSVAAGLDADALVIEERCNELVRQGQFLAAESLFARPDGTKVARYRFTHHLYPHAIAGRVPAGRRLRLHQRVGEWLEHTYGAKVAAIAGSLAWHFEEAGDYDRAIRYLVLAAENAAGRFAYADAVRVLEQARSLVHHLAADARSMVEIELLQRVGDGHYGRGAWNECAEAYEAAAARAAADGSTASQIHALRGLIRPYGVLDPDRGIAAIEQAVRLSATLDDPLLHARTELLAAGIRLTYDAWRTQDWEICASAIEKIRGLTKGDLPAFDRVAYAHLRVLRGEYAEALKNLEAGIPKENDPTSIMVPMFALSVRTYALLCLGRLGELAQLLREGREIAEQNGNEPWLFVSREAWLHTAVLDFAGACQLCEGMAARSTAYWRGASQSIGGIAAGYAALEQGKYDDASRSFAQVLDLKKTPKFFLHWYWRKSAELGLSNVWLAAGNLRTARVEADRFLQSAFATGEPNLHALAWDVDARIAMAEKDWKAAQEKIEKGLAVVHKFEIPTTAWRVHATRADLYRLTKNETAAEAARARAEAIIVALASSFAPDDPLRHAFLAAAPVRKILRVGGGNKGGRQRRGSR